MSGNKNKGNDKERLQKQSEHRATGLADSKRQQDGYTRGMAVNPAEHILQTDSTKVQNPNRNLAKGGNNTNAKFTSA